MRLPAPARATSLTRCSRSLADPTTAPTAAAATSGGTLVDGQTLYYQVSYLDEFGLETAASPEVAISLNATPGSTVPPNPTGATVDGDTLPAATYYYALTVLTASGESALGPEAIITITADQNHVDVGLPALPGGATGFGVWRQAITDAGWTRIGTGVTGASFADAGFPTGSCLTDPATQPPDGLVGIGTNAVTVTVPDPAPVSALPSSIKRWRLYRTDVSGNYGAASLVAEVAVTGLDEPLPTSFTDTGAPLLAGQPLLVSTMDAAAQTSSALLRVARGEHRTWRKRPEAGRGGCVERDDDEQPPQRIWHDEEAIKEWFEEVERRRKNRMAPAGDQVQEVPMDDNELARMWRS